MNIICNNCVGARLYEVTDQQFPNPFMWCAIQYTDFIQLIKDYNKLDFEHPKFTLENYKTNTYQSVLVTVNSIKLHFIHYIYDEKQENVLKRNTNVIYKDILTYAKNKWFSRLKRSEEEPIFLYSFNYHAKEDKSYDNIINQLFEIKNKKIIILIHNRTLNKVIPNNIRVFKYDDNIMALNGPELANAIKDDIFKCGIEILDRYQK